ncbi:MULTISPECIES: hypothetical protein [unclassified Geobacillus]|uniref:hypothetical protein n=1 Tax=unclassified Geobacillus TaxID=2642459 RepID=UPI000BE34098|nr:MULTISPECIES: hypothetical protein [unclassified Geobacillus]PDM41506.1 hypothetical protein CN643_14460 [Parageobacillus yumthangensis]PUF89975.1 hypothetical protein DCC82_13925 [Geobacillus sp. LYN3]RDV21336.1 hypothetical protein DXK91_14745 [Parageobacillus toebii]TXK89123.1 hypothetical protein FVE68_01110 [Geobacillus sp. AYS3]
MNEKGYSLVVTLLIITIFFILGLTILSVAIYQARFTEVRVEDVESFHEATKAIEETIAEMKVKVENLQLSTPALLDADLGNVQSGFIQQLMERYGVSIQDITENKEIDRNKLFTRVYVISKAAGKRTVSRQVIVASTPSFLKYALGSQENVVLNGGAYIEGNIYAGKNAYMTNVANYIDFDNNEYMEPTSFPTSKNSVLFVNESYNSCNHEKAPCYEFVGERFLMSKENYSDERQPQDLSIQKEREEFIDVNFEWTVKDKLLNAAGIGTFDQKQNYNDYIQKSINELFDKLKLEGRFDNVDFESVSELQKKIDSTDQSIILRPKDSSEISLDGGVLDLQKKWLIIDGDLVLKVNKPITIKEGNIIVFGDLKIFGIGKDKKNKNIDLDSTVYVFGQRDLNVPGRTWIYNANINITDDKDDKDDDKVVVLLSRGPLEIARINEFENNFSQTPNLKGYFYTESNATVYAVGSYINIEGGLFARGDTSSTAPDFDVSGLVINAYRGQVDRPNRLSFTQSNDIEQSRFVIRHDKSVFINRGEGLPFVDKLSLVVDKLIVK